MQELHYLISPAAILVSALIAGHIALTSTKKQKSIDFIIHSKGDDRLQAGLAAIRDIHINQHDEIKKYSYSSFQPSPLSKPSTESNEKLEAEFKKKASAIRYTLNHFEYMAVGVCEGIYCESLLKKSMNSTIKNLFDRTEQFIAEIRRQSGQNTAYEEFESLAKKWGSHDNGKQKNSIIGFLSPCEIFKK